MQNRFPIYRPLRHLAFLIGTLFALFYLQVALMLPLKFQVNWPFGSGEVKNRFSRWRPSWISDCERWWPSWISDQNDMSYFDLLVILMLPMKF